MKVVPPVDGEIEECQVAFAVCHLKFGADRPDVFWPQWRLGSGSACPLFPRAGDAFGRIGRWIYVVLHGHSPGLLGQNRMVFEFNGYRLADWRLLTGVKLPRQPQACEAVHDPKRHFATGNYRIAKRLFDHLVGADEQRGRRIRKRCNASAILSGVNSIAAQPLIFHELPHRSLLTAVKPA